MDHHTAYNPLDKDHLAESIVREFLKRPLHPLAPEKSFSGAGIYALYYSGPFPLYRAVSASFTEALGSTDKLATPIYIGKSDPPGSRKGLFADADEDDDAKPKGRKHNKLFVRLKKHGISISHTTNLEVGHFRCRYMLVDTIWVPLGEARLVEYFKPLWNVLIDGLGSNVEGGGREKTARSAWDIIHPGRKEDLKLQVSPEVEPKIIADLRGAKTIAELTQALKQHRDAKRAFAKARKNLPKPPSE